MLQKIGLTYLTGILGAALSSQAAPSEPKYPTKVEHITITGKEAQSMIDILTDSIDAAAPDLAKAANLKLRRVLCVNVVSDVGDANYECTFRPNTVTDTPSNNEPIKPNTSSPLSHLSPLIDAIQNTGCMMSPEVMPLVCDIGFNDSDLPVLADRAEPLFGILAEYAPLIPPFAPYLLFGVEHLECKTASSDSHPATCSMQAKKVEVPE